MPSAVCCSGACNCPAGGCAAGSWESSDLRGGKAVAADCLGGGTAAAGLSGGKAAAEGLGGGKAARSEKLAESPYRCRSRWTVEASHDRVGKPADPDRLWSP